MKRVLASLVIICLVILPAASAGASGSGNDNIPSPDDVLNQLGGGKAVNANQAMSALVAKLVGVVRFVQSWIGVLVLIIVIIGAILAGLGMAFNNRDLKRSGVGAIIGAIFAYGLVRLAPVLVAALMRST